MSFYVQNCLHKVLKKNHLNASCFVFFILFIASNFITIYNTMKMNSSLLSTTPCSSSSGISKKNQKESFEDLDEMFRSLFV